MPPLSMNIEEALPQIPSVCTDSVSNMPDRVLSM